MQIKGAIDITELTLLRCTSTIEAGLISSGLTRNSFCVFKVLFSDDSFRLYFDYPTDMDDESAYDFFINSKVSK
jgi:hypothetical protein